MSLGSHVHSKFFISTMQIVQYTEGAEILYTHKLNTYFTVFYYTFSHLIKL